MKLIVLGRTIKQIIYIAHIGLAYSSHYLCANSSSSINNYAYKLVLRKVRWQKKVGGDHIPIPNHNSWIINGVRHHCPDITPPDITP